MLRRRLHLGIDAALEAAPRATGHGNMWHHVLAGLRSRPGVDVRVTWGRRREDVHLVDGHQPVARTSAPVVAHLHEAGWSTPELRAVLDPAFLAAVEAGTAASLARAAAVITPSASSKRQIVEGFGYDADRIVVVPHGADPAVFHPGAAAGHAPPTPAPYVLFAAIAHPRKNIAALRDAMDELAVRGMPHELVVVLAPAPDRADGSGLLAAAAAPLPRSGRAVVAVDRPSDAQLAALMAGAAAFCLPSLMEGFGMPVLEAMACGTAVVVSDRGALPEVVGDAGVVVAPTAEGVLAGLEPVLTDDARRAALGAAAHERASAMTWDRTVDGWLAVLRRVGAEGDGG